MASHRKNPKEKGQVIEEATLPNGSGFSESELRQKGGTSNIWFELVPYRGITSNNMTFNVLPSRRHQLTHLSTDQRSNLVGFRPGPSVARRGFSG
ncbi:hypothetical protein J6590_101041 [Homalodisca vitripennis]|nr:hypothetical protein J6590_101041 [Homalodisca vitripennis]